jgi:hypothetical protein
VVGRTRRKAAAQNVDSIFDMAQLQRIVALDIRASKFGFVVLEGPDKLLDWGVRSFGEQIEELKSAASDRISTLLEFYNPVTVVVRDRAHNSSVQSKRVRAIIVAIGSATERSSTDFRVLTTIQVRDRLALDGPITKHDIAKSLAERFEELSFKLPSRRKIYQSEAPAMLVFDALATGVAFLAG